MPQLTWIKALKQGVLGAFLVAGFSGIGPGCRSNGETEQTVLGAWDVGDTCESELTSGSHPPKGMLHVPAGGFWQGCSPDLCPACDGSDLAQGRSSEPCSEPQCHWCEGHGCMDGYPLRQRWLDSFAIDLVEVTVDEYESCVQAGACPEPLVEPSTGTGPVQCEGELSTWARTCDSSRSLPVNCVSWFDAQAYCLWRGKRLCSEAEWEKAARGPADSRVFPWTDDSVSSDFFWGKEAEICDYALVMLLWGEPCESDLMAVGSRPEGASQYGVLDMTGSVAEWVEDWYEPSYYYYSPASNPSGPASGDHRGVRGGAFTSVPGEAHTAWRGNLPPATRYSDVGIRCCWSASRAR